MIFFGNKKDVVQFVADILIDSRFALALITIINRGTSEDCSVRIVTDTWLEDIAKIKAQSFSLRLTHT